VRLYFGEIAVFKKSILAVTVSMVIGSALVSPLQARVYRNQVQNAAKCHAMIDSKGLKGDAFKGEMNKCKENPDNYK
jgi:hypothetical protein